MENTIINYWAVLVAGIASMAVGMIWYSPALFGKVWITATGKTQEELMEGQGMGKTYGITFVLALLMAYVLAQFARYLDVNSAIQGIQLGFWVWLGFVVTVGANSILFERRPAKLYWINMGYYLVQLFVMGLILALWR